MPNASDVLGKTLLPLLSVVGAIGLLAFVIYLIRSWLRDNDGPAASDHQLLAGYREMNLQGELTDEEYRIIKSRMASRLGPTARPANGTPAPSTENLGKD